MTGSAGTSLTLFFWTLNAGAGISASIASSQSGLTGTAVGAPVAPGSGRETEFRSVLAAAKDCTDEVDDDDRCAGEGRGRRYYG